MSLAARGLKINNMSIINRNGNTCASLVIREFVSQTNVGAPVPLPPQRFVLLARIAGGCLASTAAAVKEGVRQYSEAETVSRISAILQKIDKQ